MTDRLMARLLELAPATRQSGAIMAGGLGLLCKRRHLIRTGQRTIAGDPALLPEARATLDVDLFLRLEMFVTPGKAAGFLQSIEALGYSVKTPKFQYSVANEDGSETVLDLLSREPQPGDSVSVKPPRVGAGMGLDLHAYCTPEAFAVEDEPVAIDLETDGGVQAVDTAHPYAWANMKVRAARDWLQAVRDGMTVAHAVAWEGLRLTLGIDNDSTLPASV